MKVHEYHARSLEATLSRADEAIYRMERLLSERGQGGVVRKIEDTLAAEARDGLLIQLGTLRDSLAAVATTFSLESHLLDIRQVLFAEISTLWVLFENCRPARMKGYGQEFTPEARVTLERNIDKLLAQVLAMRSQVDLPLR
ncbi:MAG TPA: hypothetical protein VKQ28_13490 [Candidatus Acidoferrum sp.]|nr:hypothetical protein [Candidatus Acidoferrum sp.]